MAERLTNDGRVIDTLAYSLQAGGPPLRRLEAALDFLRTQYVGAQTTLMLAVNVVEQRIGRVVPGPYLISSARRQDKAQCRVLRIPAFRQKIDESFAEGREKILECTTRQRSCSLVDLFSHSGSDNDEWRDRFLRPVGVEDIWNESHPVGNGVVGAIAVPRSVGSAPLSPDQLVLLNSVARVLVPSLLRFEPVLVDPTGDSILSKSQLLVLEQAVTGQTEKQIALKLHRSHHTVHSHLKTIYRHYGVSSRAELIALVLDGEIDLG